MKPNTLAMKTHPICEIFPMMSESEFAGLLADMQQHGQIEPILLNEDGLIVDGRNRFKACCELKIEPKTKKVHANGSLTSLVVSMNLHRRHLSFDQQVGVGAKLVPLYAKEAAYRKHEGQKSGGRGNKNLSPKTDESLAGQAASQAAQAVHVGRTAITEALAAEKETPGVVEQLAQGETTLKDVRKKARKQKQQRKQSEALATVKADEKLWLVTADKTVVPCQALITDPPYGILNEQWEPSDLEKFTREWAARWNECGADITLIFWSQRHLWEGRQWFDDELTAYKFQQLLAWHYPNNKSPQSRAGFKQTWEPIFFYRRVGSSREIKVAGDQWGDGLNDFDCHVSAVPQSNFNGAEMKQHPAQKPVSVFRWLINAVTNPGDIVADPFAGSGTSGIAATQLQRRYHGIEISPEYRQLAEGRIAAHGLL